MEQNDTNISFREISISQKNWVHINPNNQKLRDSNYLINQLMRLFQLSLHLISACFSEAVCQ